MKRYIIILIAFSMLFSLSGCANLLPTTEPSTNPSQADRPTDSFVDSTEPVYPTAPLTAVSIPTVVESVYADDGAVIFQYTYQTLALTLSGQAAADHVIVDFLNRIDSHSATIDSSIAAAKAAYTPVDSWIPYSCSIIYEPMRIDRSTLSLFGSAITYNGASHPERACISANYDLLSGDVLTLGSILTHQDSVAQLCELVIQELTKLQAEKYLRSGFEADVKVRFSQDPSFDQDWYFSETGLCFYFSPYEIAPYSSGVIVAEVPYSALTGILADEFFPGEQVATSGNVAFSAFQPDHAEKYTQITEVIMDPVGDMLLISTDGCIQDVRVTITDAQTLEEITIFAAHQLIPTDALVVQADAERFQSLQLHYLSNGNTITIPLTTP